MCSYKGHSNCDYKIDSCLTHDDAHVISGSEDGKIYFWDLVEVCVYASVYVCLGWGNHFLFPMRGCLEFELVRDFDLWRFRLVLCREVILIQYSFSF